MDRLISREIQYSDICEKRTQFLDKQKGSLVSEVSSFYGAICSKNSLGPDEVSLFYRCPHFAGLLYIGFTVF
jgi:hypothetical protein